MHFNICLPRWFSNGRRTPREYDADFFNTLSTSTSYDSVENKGTHTLVKTRCRDVFNETTRWYLLSHFLCLSSMISIVVKFSTCLGCTLGLRGFRNGFGGFANFSPYSYLAWYCPGPGKRAVFSKW